MGRKLLVLMVLLGFSIFSLASNVVYISTWGFNLDLLNKNIYKPFEEKYGVKIVPELGNNSVRLSKLIERKDNPVIDVVHFADYYAALAKKEG
ncbi:MAG: ABC transporter substrate-binding protein, partial [Thermotogae bacterium]|nr:ABC transporter substrate-binding protein [Thermotogota bacterium]